MTDDLLRLWAERDEAKAAWRAFVAEAVPYTCDTDPVLAALDTPADQRMVKQQQTVEEYWKRRTALLEAVHEAERRVRVASGHERP